MHCKSYSHFFSKKFRHIRVSLDVNFNESLTNDVVSFEQLGPEGMFSDIAAQMLLKHFRTAMLNIRKNINMFSVQKVILSRAMN